MSYNFKPTPELIWSIIVTVVGGIATAVATQGDVAPTDWRVWAAATVAGILRAVVGLLLDKTNVRVGGPKAPTAESTELTEPAKEVS